MIEPTTQSQADALDSMREWRVGPLRILAALSRGPDWLWGHTDRDGRLRTRHVVSLHYLETADGRRVWGAYLWRLCLAWGTCR